MMRSMHRQLDGLIAWLMRPSVRRVRRWSFLVTFPVLLLVAHVYGVHQGAAVLAGRTLLWGAVAVVAWRLGGARGEAVRDLVMHPRVRAFCRAELDVLTALPRLVLGGISGLRTPGATYERGTFGLALALAFTPVIAAEGGVLHLLLGGGWVAWVLTAAHVYMLLWLWGFALGPRAFPHRVGARTVVLRAGPLYRVLVPRPAIVAAEVGRERVSSSEHGIVQCDGAVLLPVRGRVDVWLELSEPVPVQRPLREPLLTRRLAVASDDPDRLVQRLLAPALDPARHAGLALGVAAVLDAGGLARDAAQPA